MEAFSFLKLWKTSPVVAGDLIPPPEYDDEDAFFDLEILNYYEHKQIKFTSESSDEDCDKNSPKSSKYSGSPISFLRSPPKFLKFKGTKISTSTTPVLSRTNSNSSSSNKYNNNNNRKVVEGGANGVVRKYLRMMMKIRISGERESEDSPWKSPSRKGMRSPSLSIVSSRCLGKSRGCSVPAEVLSLRSDSVVQSDGIQSAILHCKRSFNPSPTATDFSALSRSVSEPVISANPSRFSIEDKKRISI